jgi:TolA-binding protein
MQTKAAPEPSRHSTSALASLVTRAKAQQGAAPADPEHGDTLALDLWSSRISAPDARDEAETSLTLKRLIHQVHVLATNDKNAARPTPESPRAPQPPKAAPVDAESVEPAQARAAVTTASEATPALSPAAQKTLNDLQKSPSRVGDPLETAELLFLSGRPTDAAPFYQEALRHTHAGDPASADDRAWILFQLGNCLRETDAAKAQDAYAKLIAEFPNSSWTEMARAGSRLLTWYQSTRPDQLMTARKP